jgi:hypothetical protein
MPYFCTFLCSVHYISIFLLILILHNVHLLKLYLNLINKVLGRKGPTSDDLEGIKPLMCISYMRGSQKVPGMHCIAL